MLHTWGQNLHLHPHLHCVVPGGGFSLDGCRWIACRKDSLPYKVLSRQFRKLFLHSLGRAFRKGRLHLSGELRDLAKPAAFHSLCEAAAKLEWVVHVKPPFGGPRRATDRILFINGGARTGVYRDSNRARFIQTPSSMGPAF